MHPPPTEPAPFLAQLALEGPANAQEAYAQGRAPWKAQRVAAYNALTQTLTPRQLEMLGALLSAHAQEHQHTGALHADAAARRSVRASNGQAMREAAQVAHERRWNNAQTYELLKKASDDNEALRQRAEAAEGELAALQATLPTLERRIRASIIAGALDDHPALPRPPHGSGVYAKHLSHTVLIRQHARTVEEFLSSGQCGGYARLEKIQDCLPWLRRDLLGLAMTHLLKSGRVRKTASGAFRLLPRATGRNGPAAPPLRPFSSLHGGPP